MSTTYETNAQGEQVRVINTRNGHIIRMLDRPPLPVIPTLTGDAIIAALTDAELSALLALAKTSAQAELAYTRLARLPATPATDARLNAVLDRMVSAGIITAARKTEILAS